ncbi:hypothetical protein [Paenibacillus alvei]|uniref:hypothetical protein n=1 Tax=Paenibacillus alvei TaxID=44250 RepID=UPI002282DC07|nr:hypothetical protein [Paenibacillus alvei]MCY7486624.1 hypothetical protein [Paenibacillus alvei]
MKKTIYEVCIHLTNQKKHCLHFDSEDEMNEGIASLFECINGEGNLFFFKHLKKCEGVAIPRSSIVSFEYSSKLISVPKLQERSVMK